MGQEAKITIEFADFQQIFEIATNKTAVISWETADSGHGFQISHGILGNSGESYGIQGNDGNQFFGALRNPFEGNKEEKPRPRKLRNHFYLVSFWQRNHF